MTKKELIDKLQGVSDDAEILMTSKCLCIGDVLKGSMKMENAFLDTMKAPNL